MRSASRSSPPPTHPLIIVGIGASAGGLEPIRLLLSHLSVTTGMAFVIVQHLSPKHESLLVEILSRATAMPVLEAETGTRVQSNHVYVIPPNVSLKILNGTLVLEKRDPDVLVPLPIDAFFKSLAIDQKERSIGVVLSGSGADGAQGAKEIKAEGGITFAQSPESAQFVSMPSETIRVDHVDYIMSPTEIALELNKLSTNPGIADANREGFSDILQFLKHRMNTDFTDYKPTTIYRRISRRLGMNKVSNFSSYLEILKSNPAEAKALIEDTVIHVTEFFREPEAIELLKTKVFNRIFKEQGETGIRIWIPGCSTGEEAYSIAIALSEYLENEGLAAKVQIFATDLSEKCIDAARRGHFGPEISHQVSESRLNKYFTQTETGYRINKSIRDLCIFATQDLTRTPPYSKIDLISCRNMLIYFNQALQSRILEIFNYALNPQGFLLLGKSENLGPAINFFLPVDSKEKIYSKKGVFPKTVPVGWFPYPEHKSADFKPAHDLQLSNLQMQNDIDRSLLARFTPPSVVINSNYEVLQFRGRTDLILSHKNNAIGVSLFKMAGPTLSGEIRNTVMESMQKGAPARSKILTLEGYSRACIEVSPLSLSGRQCFLVSFDRPDPNENASGGVVVPNPSSSDTTVNELREELMEAKNQLNSMIDEFERANQELQSANEEIVSTNEELQSTNEELETSKEELQSTNEELNTVNEELQARNQELFVVNNDLSNLINSFYLPIIIVGNDLTIRRFTPTASKVLNVKAGDIGRPITDITSPLIDMTKLVRTVHEVIDSAVLQESEIKDKHGHWHQLRVRPYKTQEHKLDGAVITLFDIDQFKSGVLFAEKPE